MDFLNTRTARRERTVYHALAQEKNLKAIMMLSVGHLLSAGAFFLLFYLLGGAQWNGGQVAFFGLVSMLCSAILFTAELPESLSKVVPWVGYGVCVLYFYYILAVHGYTSWTAESQPVMIRVTDSAMRWIKVLGVLLLIYEFRADLRRAILTCLLTGALFCTYQPNGRPLLIEFTGVIMLSNLLKDPKTSAKIFLGALVFYVAFLLIGVRTGWLNMITMQFSYGQPSLAWGMNHTNLPPLVLMTMLFLIWYLWLQKKPIATFLLFEAGATVSWFLFYCRTAMVVMAVFPLLCGCGMLAERKEWKKLWKALPLAPVLLALLSFALLFFLPTLREIIKDRNFLARFEIPYSEMERNGLSWYQPTVNRDIVIDNVFLHILFFYGIIPAVILPFFMTGIGYRYARNNQRAELILFAAMMIYSLMENAVIHMPFGFVFLFFLPLEDPRHGGGLLHAEMETMERIRAEAIENSRNKPDPKQKPASWKKNLVTAIICYLVLSAGFYWVVSDDWKEIAVATDPVNQDVLLPELNEENRITQTFAVNADRLNEMILYARPVSADEDNSVFIRILDEDKELFSEEKAASEIPESGELHLDVSRLPEGLKGRKLKLELRGTGGVAFWTGTTRSAGKVSVKAHTEEILTVDGVEQPGELVMQLRGANAAQYNRWYWPVAGAMGVVLLAAAIFTHICRSRGKVTVLTRATDLIRQYEYLLKTLVVRDFKVRYKASVLGALWSFLNPLMMTFVYFFVFSTIFRSSIPNFPIYLMSGIILFNFFSEATNLGMQSIVGNAGLITKVYIPKYIFPISKVLSSAVNLAISLLPLLVMMLITGTPIRKSMLLLPVVILYLVLFCVGVSLILSAIMVYFRDIQFLWGIVLTILNFLSPIFYPESIIPVQFIKLYHLNPLYQYLFFMRTIVVGGISPTPITYLYCTFFSVLALVAGLLIFRKAQSDFVLHL